MATRFEETLAEVRGLQSAQASDDQIEAAMRSNGYTPDRFIAAYSRYAQSGEQPIDVSLSNKGQKVRRAASAASFGISPIVEALWRGGGSNYYPMRDALREADTADQIAYPNRSMGPELLGGALGGVPFMFAKPAATTGGQVAQQALFGGIPGAVQGALTAQPGSEGTGAGVGGLVGATIGGAVPLIGRGISGVGGFVGSKVSKGAADIRSELMGIDKLDDALKMDGYDRQYFMDELAKYENPSTLSMLDLVQPQSNTAKLLRGAIMGVRPSRSTAFQKLEERPITAMRELPDEVTRRTGVQPIVTSTELERMTGVRRANANPAYEKAYTAGSKPLTDPAAVAFFNDPYVQKVLMPKAEALYAQKAKTDTSWVMPTTTQRVPDKIDPMTGQPLSFKTVTTPYMDVRLFDTLKKADAITNKAYQRGLLPPGEGDLTQKAITADFMSTVREPAVSAVKKAVPEYGQALKQFSDDVAVEEAFDLGKRIFTTSDPKELVAKVAKMSAAEKDAFRAAAVNEYQVKIAKIPETSACRASKAEDIPDMRQRLSLLFENQDDFYKYMTHLNKQGRLAQSKDLFGNSQTPEKNFDLALANSPNSSLGAAVQGNAQPLITNLLGKFARLTARQPNAAISEAITRQGLGLSGMTGIDKALMTLRNREIELAKEQFQRGLYSPLVAGAARGGLLGGQ